MSGDRSVVLEVSFWWNERRGRKDLGALLEPACNEKRPAHFKPARLRQIAHRCADSFALRQRDVVEIQRARHRHSIVGRQYDFRAKAPNSSCRGDDYDLVETLRYRIAREDEHRAAFVRYSKCVPADFAPPQPTFSQPSPSHASGSSSLENSSGAGGATRYKAAASAPGGAVINLRRRTRSLGVRHATRGTISSAVTVLAMLRF